MAYPKVGPWVNGAPPALSAANLDQIETQYDQVFTDITHGDLAGVTPDLHHAQSHGVADHNDIILAIKPSDETVNSAGTGSTMQNDDDLLFAVGANEEWLVEVYIIVNSGATPDFKCRWSLPASCLADGQYQAPSIGSSFGFQIIHDASVSTQGQIGTDTPVKLWSIIRVGGTAGNVQFQWAQNTADAGDTKVLRGSMLVARRIS